MAKTSEGKTALRNVQEESKGNQSPLKVNTFVSVQNVGLLNISVYVAISGYSF
jgi:hypothetical protein